jgi:transcriptional regulator with XRE-family HTH domain
MFSADTEKIKVLCWRKRTSFARMARNIGCTREEISRVANGHERRPKLREAIARELGVPTDALFPEGNDEIAA